MSTERTTTPYGFFAARKETKLLTSPVISTTMTQTSQRFFDLECPGTRYDRFCVRMPACSTDGYSDFYGGKPEASLNVDDDPAAAEMIEHIFDSVVADLESKKLGDVLRRFTSPKVRGRIKMKFQNNSQVFLRDGSKGTPADIKCDNNVIASLLVAGYNMQSSDRAGLFFKVIKIEQV